MNGDWSDWSEKLIIKMLFWSFESLSHKYLNLGTRKILEIECNITKKANNKYHYKTVWIGKSKISKQ